MTGELDRRESKKGFEIATKSNPAVDFITRTTQAIKRQE